MNRGVRRRITSMLVDGVDAVGVIDLSGFGVSTVGRKQTLTGGGGAPTNATYVVVSLSGSLSAERRAQASSPLSLTDGGANGDLTWGIQVATGTQHGYLSSTDWTTFNNKASAASVAAAIATAEAYSDAALAAHVAAADPHPQYTTAAELVAYAQQLDADLTTIAGLTVTRGGIMLGSAAPAWSVLAIGTTGKYLRSDGTDPSWSAIQNADLPAAGGDSSGTLGAMTNTLARGLRETAGPTTLTMGAVADGQVLQRVGSTIVGLSLQVLVAYCLVPDVVITPSGVAYSTGTLV